MKTELCQRMYGPGVVLSGDSPESAPLRPGIGPGQLRLLGNDLGGARGAREWHDRVFATQELDGLCLGPSFRPGLGRPPRDGGPDWWPNLQPVQADPALTQASVASLAADMAVGEAGTWAPPT